MSILEPFEHGIYERALAAARVALGDEEFAAAFAGGQQMTMDEAMTYAPYRSSDEQRSALEAAS